MVKAGPLGKKIQERLRWFVHVERREDDYIGKKVKQMGNKGKRRRGYLKVRWNDM